MLEKLYKLNPSDYEKLYKGELVTIGTRTLQLNLSDYSLTVDGATPAIPSADYTIEVSDTYATDDEIENMFSDQESVATPQDVANLFGSFDPATRSLLVDLIYPVGSVFVNANNVNPGTIVGGTWEALGVHYIPKGDVPVNPGNDHDIVSEKYIYFKKAVSGDNVMGDGQFHSIGYAASPDAKVTLRAMEDVLSGRGDKVVISNLWSENSNINYNTAVYLFKRTA